MKGFVLKWFRRLTLAALVLAGASMVFFVLTPQGRAGYQTAFFVLQVMDLGPKPQSWFSPEPSRRQVNFPLESGAGEADVYRVPGKDGRAAVLIFLGANAAGRDDPDVLMLGNSLARAGFAAMFYWSPTMALQSNIDSAEIDNLVWAFQFLRSRDYVDPERTGMAGFCVGASFALVAAADPRIRDGVTFVNAFGPYYDAGDLLRQFAGRARYYEGEREPWEPDVLTMRVVANELIETVADARAKEALARRYLYGEAVEPAILDALPPEAQTVRRILDGAPFEEADALYDALPAHFREDMKAVSPSAHVDGLRARVMVMHTRGDRLVPSVESRRLADALEGRGGNYRYTEVLAFDHVRPTSSGDLWFAAGEAFKLYRHMYGIMREGV